MSCLRYSHRFAAVDLELAAGRSVAFVCHKGRHRSPAVCAMYLLRGRFVASPEAAMECVSAAAKTVRAEAGLPQWKDEGPHWAPGLRPVIQEFAALVMPIVGLAEPEAKEEEEDEGEEGEEEDEEE